MRIAVTGGAGFIGSHVVERLVARGHELLVLDDLSTGSLQNLVGGLDQARLERVDVRDRAACAASLAAWRPEALLHLAAVASVPRSVAEPALVHDVNANGTFNVLDAFRVSGGRRFVFASSAAVYGPEPMLPSDEADPVNPASPYAAQKAGAELLLRAYRSVWGLETVALRFFNVFGERQRPDDPYSGVLSLFSAGLRAKGRATITGDGEQSRDFIYVGDVVRAIVVALIEADPGFGPVNVGRGESTTIRQLYRLLAGRLGVADAPEFVETRPGDVHHSRARIDRLHAALGIWPEVTVAEGIARLLAWQSGAPGQ